MEKSKIIVPDQQIKSMHSSLLFGSTELMTAHLSTTEDNIFHMMINRKIIFFSSLPFLKKNIIDPSKANTTYFSNPEWIFSNLLRKSNIDNWCTVQYSGNMGRLEDSERQIIYPCSSSLVCFIFPALKKERFSPHTCLSAQKHDNDQKVIRNHLTFCHFYKRCNRYVLSIFHFHCLQQKHFPSFSTVASSFSWWWSPQDCFW